VTVYSDSALECVNGVNMSLWRSSRLSKLTGALVGCHPRTTRGGHHRDKVHPVQHAVKRSTLAQAIDSWAFYSGQASRFW